MSCKFREKKKKNNNHELSTTSRIAFYYSHPSILPAPKVPKPPDEFGTANMDVLGRLYDEATSAVPLVPGINTINCNLTELWNDLMQYICQGAITGSDTDLRSRKSFYCRLLAYVAQLPPRFHCWSNMTPETCMKRYDKSQNTHSYFLKP